MPDKSDDGNFAPEVVMSHIPERAPTPDYEGKINIYEPYPEQQKLFGSHREVDHHVSKERRICGVAVRTFWVLILLMVVILAAAIGGGVGGGLTSQHKSITSTSAPQSNTDNTTTNNPSITNNPSNTSNPSSSSTSNASNPSNTSSPNSIQYYSGCNLTDMSIYTPLNGNSPYAVNGTVLSYLIYCNKNFASGGSNIGIANIPGVANVRGLTTLDECITVCAEYNTRLSATRNVTWGELCSGVVYYVHTTPTSICWLQNGTTAGATDAGGPNEVVSAVLQWPIP